ncbi:unnamed protein product [Strongylus vulgaris]|uniref:Uncharacterized protein n=1 Tax=Strongylus vulgaris TaxID=40348 RepID=A0A3P7JGD9_STRVU|nr:unnamed protein product [Strongylus vulgaris]
MSDGQVPDHYWKNLLAITTKATAESQTTEVTPRPMSEECQRQHLSLQCRYAEFLLSLTENNPQTQSLFAREGVLTKLMKILENDNYDELLVPDILSNFLYVLQNFANECKSELDYIGEYILDFVDIKAIPKELAKEMAASLEYLTVDIPISGNLVKKLRAIT